MLSLPLRLAAGQFLDLRLLRSARIVAGLQRLFSLALLARGSFGFLAFIFAKRCRVCHECIYLSSSNQKLLLRMAETDRLIPSIQCHRSTRLRRLRSFARRARPV